MSGTDNGRIQEPALDIVIPFRHSQHEDEELRYVLRSIERHFTEAGKVWILGDRPEWLTTDKRVAEHVDHAYLSRPFRFRLPVRNHFLLALLGSLIPELPAEFVLMADDNVFLQSVDAQFLAKVRAIDDPAKAMGRGRGLYKDALWRTIDTLRRLDYPALNYESHIPHVLSRRWVWEAYCEFADFISEDRFYGMLVLISVFNYRMKHEPFEPTWLLEEGKFIGFYADGLMGAKLVEASDRETVGNLQSSVQLLLTDQIRRLCAGKTFLGFDDASFTIAMHQFLDDEFPEPSRFERSATSLPGWGELDALAIDTSDLTDDLNQWSAAWPEIIMRTREDFPHILNHLGLTSEGAEVGTRCGEFASTILQTWQGKCLHCIDSWTEQLADPNYCDVNNVPQLIHDHNHAATVKRLAPYGNRCRIHRLDSAAAATNFADQSLDFVYLDARHYRAGLEEDLNLWSPKIGPGGILCGHDYLDGVLPSGHFEVKSTIDAWAQSRGLEIKTSGEPIWRSWFIRMP